MEKVWREKRENVCEVESRDNKEMFGRDKRDVIGTGKTENVECFPIMEQKFESRDL